MIRIRDSSFTYETRHADKLDKKFVKFDVFDSNKIMSDVFIGTVSIDLLTIAAGPVSHELVLRDNGRPAGKLAVSIEMAHQTEISITLKVTFIFFFFFFF